jgi:hypothetical protein
MFITFPELPLLSLELANDVFRHQIAALKFSALFQHPGQQPPPVGVDKGDVLKINGDLLAWSRANQIRPGMLCFVNPGAGEFAFKLKRDLLFVARPSDSQHGGFL